MTKPNAQLAARYSVARTDSGQDFVLTESSTKIIKKLSQRKGIQYGDLSRATDIPESTLMVYAQRMQRAGLVTRSQQLVHSRYRTFLYLAQGVKVNTNTRRI